MPFQSWTRRQWRPARVARVADEPTPRYNRHIINDRAAAREFMLAGNAVFTLVDSAGTRHTYRIRAAEADQRDSRLNSNPVTHWISLLTGSDNVHSYQYIGQLRSDNSLEHGRRSRISASSPGWTLLSAYYWDVHNTAGIQFWHEGRCGRCGRRLTVPESIARGIGPECASLMREADRITDAATRWGASHANTSMSQHITRSAVRDSSDNRRHAGDQSPAPHVARKLADGEQLTDEDWRAIGEDQ